MKLELGAPGVAPSADHVASVRWRLVVRIIAAAAVLFVVLAAFSAWRVAGRAQWSPASGIWLPLLLALGAGSYFLRFARWHVLVSEFASALPIATSARIYMAGFALGLTPGRLGEFLKFSFLRRATALPEALTAPIFPLERATEAVSFLFLAVVGASFGQIPLRTLGTAAIVAAALLPVLALAGIGLRLLSRRFAFGNGLPSGGSLSQLLQGLSAVASVRPTLLALLCALAARCFDALLFWIASTASGLSIPPAGAAVAFGIAGLAGGLSLMPGGVAAVEASLVATVLALGGQMEPALAAALLARAVTLWMWVPSGLWFAVSESWAEDTATERHLTQPAAGRKGWRRWVPIGGKTVLKGER